MCAYWSEPTDGHECSCYTSDNKAILVKACFPFCLFFSLSNLYILILSSNPVFLLWLYVRGNLHLCRLEKAFNLSLSFFGNACVIINTIFHIIPFVSWMIFCYMNFKYLCVHLCVCVCVCTCVFWHSLMIAKNGETLCAWCVTCVCANYMCLTCFDFSDQISYFVQNFAGIKFQDERHQFDFFFDAEISI